MKIIELAIKGTEEYSKKQEDEQKEFLEIEESIKDTLKDIQTSNTVPVFQTDATVSEITTNSITILTSATDIDNDELTYTLYWGKTENYEKEAEEKKSSSGEEVVFSKTDLEDYTEYYWKVEVSDGTDVTKGIESITKTYCGLTSSYRCNVPEKTCTACGGRVYCKKQITWTLETKTLGSTISGYTCDSIACSNKIEKGGTYYYIVYICPSGHREELTPKFCSRACGERSRPGTGMIIQCDYYTQPSCITCKSTGKIKGACKHSKYADHTAYKCSEHSYDGTSSTHN